MRVVFLSITFIFIGLVGCKGQISKNIQTVNYVTFEKNLNTIKNIQLVDVRTPEEFSGSHIPNAQNINYYDASFTTIVSKLDNKEPVLIYCKAGGRSEKAAQILSKLGFTKIYNLDGGILNWIENKKPIVK